MHYNQKTIRAIVDKTKKLLKNDRIGSYIVTNNQPHVSTVIDSRGEFNIEKITFTDHRGRYVSVGPGGIYVSQKDCYMFDTDSWDEFMALDDNNVFTIDMLETGMLVTAASGKTYVVMRETPIHKRESSFFEFQTIGVLIEVGGNHFVHLNDYCENMKSKYCDPERHKENIVKVSLPINFGFNKTLKEIGEEVIWQRASE